MSRTVKFDKPTIVPTLDGPKQVGSFTIPSGGHDVYKPSDFEKKVQTHKDLGKLDIADFKNAKDLGMFIDYLNDLNAREKKEHSDKEIMEISKYLLKSLTTKTFIL